MNAILSQPSLTSLAGEALRALPRLTALLHRLPLVAAVLLAVLGLLSLARGSRHRRLLGLVIGAAAGALAAHLADHWLRAHVGLSGMAAVGAAAAIVGIGAALLPPIAVFAVGALPLSLVGLGFPIHGQAALGLAAGAAVGGVAALLLSRLVSSLAAAALGAALVGGALLVAAGRFTGLAFLSRHPLALAAVVAVLTVAGAAFQHQAGAGRPRKAGAGRAQAATEDAV